MSHDNQPATAMNDVRVPADQGLSTLGLLMQLTGSVFVGLTSMYAVILLVADPRALESTGFLVLVLAASAVRSFVHREAGLALLYGNKRLGSPLSPVNKYVAVGLAHSVLVPLIVAGKLELTLSKALTLGAALALWPLALAILLRRPRFRPFWTEIPVAEDKGFEGTAILMLVLGAIGVLCSGGMLLGMLDNTAVFLHHGVGIPLLGATVMMVIRSSLHVHAGASGLRETSLESACERANRYANFGMITAFCVCVALLLAIVPGALHPLTFVVLATVCWLLLVWPLAVRRFFSERQFAYMLAVGPAGHHRRAPDAGLTSLGWLLFGQAICSASLFLTQFVADGGVDMMRELLSTNTNSRWLTMGVLVLQAGAGLALVYMSPLAKLIATVFALVTAAFAVATMLPQFQMADTDILLRGPNGVMRLVPLAVSLVLPVVTLLLVHRKIAPTATARFRPTPKD
jgi:hypothetical protein